jgi:putative hydrolase
MIVLPDLDEDHHVHSVFSDDAVSTLDQNVRAAGRRGLRVICFADHVRRDSPWVADYTAAVAALGPVPGLEVVAGVEAKILDGQGHLDLPERLPGVGRVLIADHQFPGAVGPVHPRDIRAQLTAGQRTAAEVIDGLISATARALDQVASPQLAHLFSLLPKMGLAESDVPGPALAQLARAASRAGARLEVNEKWACPSGRTIRAFAAAGVPLVPSTDSHDCADVGQYAKVRDLLAAATDSQVPG